jgi:hypothetical protein
MHFPNVLQVALEGVVYDTLKHLLEAVIVTAAAQYVLKYAFNRLKKRQELLAFCGGCMIIFFLLFLAIDQRPSQRPNLVAGIQQVLVGPSPADRETIVVLALNVINTGTMQTIVKNWKVEAKVNGQIYQAVFGQMPSAFTFNNIPRISPNQPETMTFYSVDQIVEKSLQPIQVGALFRG